MKTPQSRTTNGKTVTHRVRFEFTAPHAESVCIAGTFNDWHPQTTPMIAVGEGRWAKDLMLRPGDHEYRLVVDGEWITDPNAAETVRNTFGTTNGVLRISGEGKML